MANRHESELIITLYLILMAFNIAVMHVYFSLSTKVYKRFYELAQSRLIDKNKFY